MHTEEQIKQRPVLLILGDIPVGSEIGIDCKIWKIAEKFKGIAAIPLGIHYVHYTVADNKDTNNIGQLRTGFFVNVKQSDVFIYIWDTANEVLNLLKDTEEIERYKRGIYNGAFENNLGAYPMEEYTKWNQLSNHITLEVVNRIEPIQKNISASSKPLDNNEKQMLQTVTKNDDNNNNNNDEKQIGNIPSHIFFTTLPKNNLFDRSDAFFTLLLKEYNNKFDLFLGELQFAFICFLIGQSFDAFDQWKKMVHLICLSEKALLLSLETTNTSLYNNKMDVLLSFFTTFLKTLQCQLKEIPFDFFENDLSKGNFLEECIKNLYFICVKDDINDCTTSCHPNIKMEVISILKYLKENVGLDIENKYNTKYRSNGFVEGEKDEEDLPVVVDLNASMF